MQVIFMRWSIDQKSRTPVSIDPTRVDCTEFFCEAHESYEKFPAATKIIMRNKQEYVVQGSLEAVVATLNKKD